jgi:hypothetical protein
MRRVLLLVAPLLAFIVPARAGAQAQDIGWYLAGFSATHWTADLDEGLHIVVDRCQTSCADTVGVINWWLPANCRIVGLTAGDGAGEPLTVRLGSYDPYRSCLPGDMAWSDGWNSDGFAWGHEWYVDRREQWVFPRDSAWPWSRGTVVRIW